MTKTKSIPFVIHSTFRHLGKQVKPCGLQWDLDGSSYMTYVPASLAEGRTTVLPDLDAPESRRGIVEAYNRWAYAKETEFKTVEDILEMTVHNNGKHIHVQWKAERHVQCDSPQSDDMEDLLKQDPACTGGKPAEVWVNGVYEGTLHGKMSLSPLLLAVKRATGPGTRLAYYRYKDSGLIRIEKYFRGMLRKHQVFEHVMDNLITLEDPEIIDSKTLIGSATVRDWIMGGQLTSRLHIEELPNGDLKFVRPLYNDDVSTADRHFGLHKGRDDVKIAMVRKELDRLRFLATLQHPFVTKKPPSDERAAHGANSSPEKEFEFDIFKMESVPHAMEESSASSSIILRDDDREENEVLNYASGTFSD